MATAPPYVVTTANVHMPKIVYGTAWKKERTTDLVTQAVLSGFRGIDTACQPKHYREDLVGQALLNLQAAGIDRKDLFLQTKFTSLDGQDPANIPYDPQAELSSQVQQSLAKSLANLHTTYLDSLVLHSPMRTHEKSLKVWREFEKFVAEGKVRQLGISNIYDLKALVLLYENASIKPAVVQNRFYDDTGYDREIRKFCSEKGIIYQSFWTLTANPHILQQPVFKQIAARLNATLPQVWFRFVMDLGIVPLTGTKDEAHMKQDLEVLQMASLPRADFETIADLIGEDASAYVK